jgi:putative chitinase
VILTLQQVASACGARIDRAQMFLPHLQAAMTAYEIDTPARAAAFLAQIGHESGGLRWTTELWGPTVAQSGYEGRRDLGNVQPGDGFKFRGHGLIQTTGRANHAKVRDRLRARLGGARVPDFEADPEALAGPEWAAWSAADYWNMRRLNALADTGDFEAISARVNGRNRATGMPNGWEDRLARYSTAQQVLA